MSRDVDSRPYDREFTAIKMFLDSYKTFHIIRDHPFHGVPILAGLFGFKAGMRSLVAGQVPATIPNEFFHQVNRHQTQYRFDSNDFYQVDQWWLRLQLYPFLGNEIYVNDEYFGFERREFRSYLPVRADDDETFIGEGFDEFDKPRYPEHRDLLNQWPRRTN